MIGAIIGDVAGSIYEFGNPKTTEFALFKKESSFSSTTVLTAAVADFSMDDRGVTSQARLCGYLHKWYLYYPNVPYEKDFELWIRDFDTVAYTDFTSCNSSGSVAASCISPIGAFANVVEQATRNAPFVAAVLHKQPEEIKAAQAIAAAIVMFRTIKDKSLLKKQLEEQYGYDLEKSVPELAQAQQHHQTALETVPTAIICFLESTSFEHAIRNALALGGDRTTLTAITGSLAEVYYQDIPAALINETMHRLPEELIAVLKKFYRSQINNYPQIAATVLNYES